MDDTLPKPRVLDGKLHANLLKGCSKGPVLWQGGTSRIPNLAKRLQRDLKRLVDARVGSAAKVEVSTVYMLCLPQVVRQLCMRALDCHEC